MNEAATYTITLEQLGALACVLCDCDGPGNTQACGIGHQIIIDVVGPDEALLYPQYPDLGAGADA